MKKTYIMPSMKMVESEAETLLVNSTAISSDSGIGYGGIDEDGEKEADARHLRSAWDDDDEE